MKDLQELKIAAEKELIENILPFWTRLQDTEGGGFCGEADGYGRVDREAPRSAVMTAGILRAFSAAYRSLGASRYLEMASRAEDYFCDCFIDTEHGGVCESVDALGCACAEGMRVDTLAQAVGGLSEYALASGDVRARDRAVSLYENIEKYAFDSCDNGYTGAFTRDWKPCREKGREAYGRKTAHTHLCLLDSYTALYELWPDPGLEKRLRNLVLLFTDCMVDWDSGRLGLFFDNGWRSGSEAISFGHEIQASWHLHQAVLLLDDLKLKRYAEPVVLRLASAASEGLQPDGSLIFGQLGDMLGRERRWWSQAECVIGYFNIYQHFGMDEALDNALGAWDYIQSKIVDREQDEWLWGRLADGRPDRVGVKAGGWKNPWQNGRMCLELIGRISEGGRSVHATFSEAEEPVLIM